MKTLIKQLLLVCFAAAVLSLIPKAANACSVCIAYPQKSATDYLIESPCVVLAREDPDKPFSYAAAETLKGKLDGQKIDLFLDSVTRRILAADPKRRVILVRESEGGAWRSLGLASTRYLAVIRRLVLFAPQWQGAKGKQRRVEFFLPLFGHEDRLISELAYLEMGRAPYRTIKQLSRVVPREEIDSMLRSRQYVQWRSLAILIVAHHGKDKDRKYVAESFRAAERFNLTTNLAAWAAASIELEGADAVSFIEREYFRAADHKKEELIEVIKALSLHGTEGHTHLRDQIAAAYKVLLDVHPNMATYIDKDLRSWHSSESAARVSQVGDRNED